MFWSINNSGEVLSNLKSRGFRATSLSMPVDRASDSMMAPT